MRLCVRWPRKVRSPNRGLLSSSAALLGMVQELTDRSIPLPSEKLEQMRAAGLVPAGINPAARILRMTALQQCNDLVSTSRTPNLKDPTVARVLAARAQSELLRAVASVRSDGGVQ